MNDLRSDFPILKNNPDLIYLDSACTTLKPRPVIDAAIEYYERYGACANRSSHRKGRETTEKIDQIRERVAGFVGGDSEGTLWTKNATEAINTVISGFDYSKKNKVITTNMEHHAVLLPLMRLRDRGKIKLEVVENSHPDSNLEEEIRKKIDKETALIVLNNANNTTGKRQKVDEIGKMAHEFGAKLCVDGAQGVPHFKCDLKKENIDFIAFSAHKMLGPTGVGALVCRKEDLSGLRPLVVGGGNVKKVELNKIEWAADQSRFEAGTQNYSGIFGFGAAIEYLTKIGIQKIEEHEKDLRKKMVNCIQNAGAQVYGDESSASALVSFNFKGAKPHEVALMLDQQGIALRSGFFCAQIALEAIGAKEGAVRASAYLYNDQEDIKKFGEKLEKIGKLYS
ncbi:cysteine desulfurase [Candidatus Micrarchaeota archaeon]|nr:cysteine desulfurase [Candidatus Micrarchaeota archaeon]